MSAKIKGRISKVEPVGSRYAVLSINPEVPRPLPQRPGQYTQITFSPEKEPLTNVYSIASAPRADGSFELCVQLTDERLKGLISLWQSGKGRTVEYTLPAGNFFVPPESVASVLIAGGSGITPLKAILEERAKQNAETVLLYGCSDDKAIPFYTDLKALDKGPTEVHFFAETVSLGRATLGRPQQKLAAYIDPDKHFLMCGPPAFMASIRHELAAAGVSDQHIHQDRY